ncbi:MAG: hypothetical protein HY512_01435 [Candidatus Aenigmarchaeota archaeon]|nr:hypothetical protein [Candidatus Aenigmarchaeota archaeon]
MQRYIFSLIDVIAAILLIVTAMRSAVVLELALPIIILLGIRGGYYAINESKLLAILYITFAVVLVLSYVALITASVAIFFAVLLFIKGIFEFLKEGLRPI